MIGHNSGLELGMSQKVMGFQNLIGKKRREVTEIFTLVTAVSVMENLVKSRELNPPV